MMNFLSDNAYGVLPEILAAVTAAAEGTAASYGSDELSQILEARLAVVFETPVAAFAVISGTAANALALATLCPAHGAILCHAEAHIAVDECAAPEFFTHGAKLVGVEGNDGKVTPEGLTRALSHFLKGFVHHPQPAVLSLSQPTECGTLYKPAEITALAAIAHAHGMKVHMDGARFGNAVVALGVSAADASWRAGVDVLSFGATKNGAIGAEAVVFFTPVDASDFAYRRKKAGHLISKMRFVSAQLVAYLADDLWLKAAQTANGLAAKLAGGLSKLAGVELVHAVEANEVFLRIPTEISQKLRDGGAQFYDWGPPESGLTVIRLVTSFATSPHDVERFLTLARNE
jgi:threonine aldolase